MAYNFLLRELMLCDRTRRAYEKLRENVRGVFFSMRESVRGVDVVRSY